MTSKVKKKKYLGFSHFFYEKWAGHVSEQVSEQVSGQDFMQNWNFFGLRGDFPYCKRFVLAGTKREPSKQSLWEKGTIQLEPSVVFSPQIFKPSKTDYGDFLPTSSACWVLFLCRRAHSVGGEGNRQKHPKCIQSCPETCSKTHKLCLLGSLFGPASTQRLK